MGREEEMSENEKQALERYFPNAVPVGSFFDRVNDAVSRLSYSRSQVKPATMMCRDDSVTGIILKLKENGYMDAFNMETLSGMPVFGMTGYNAFYHHIPDKGIGMIIFAPHLGLSERGIWGELERPGIAEMGKSCGANFAILGKWAGDEQFSNDPELKMVADELLPYKRQITNAKEPIVEIAEVEYKIGLDRLVSDIINLQKREQHMHKVMIVSGIHIDRKNSNYFDLREIGIVENSEYRLLH